LASSWRTNAAFSGGRLSLGRLLTGLLLARGSLEARLRSFFLQLLELLKTFVRHLLPVLILLCGSLPGLLPVQPSTILKHLLDLLGMGILRLLLLRERLARRAELVGLCRARPNVEPVHDAWDLFLGDVSQRVNSSTYCT
jgi:hypothetical protein